MYRSVAGGAYYGMNLGADGLSGLGDVPQPTTDALAASWCAAKGIPANFCSIAPGVLDPSRTLHIVSDPSGKPCAADYYAPDGSVNPCTYNTLQGTIDPAILAAQGITPGQYTCDPSQAQTFGGQPYMPLSCKGETLLTQAQTLSLLAALGQSPAGLPGNITANQVGTPLPSTPVTQGVYADPSTAAQVASQIPGASVQQTTGGYAVIQPANASTTPVTPYVPPSQQPAGSGIPPAGNSQAAPPSSNMWCFPGDTSAQIMPNVPVCQNTALAALGALLVLVLVLK